MRGHDICVHIGGRGPEWMTADTQERKESGEKKICLNVPVAEVADLEDVPVAEAAAEDELWADDAEERLAVVAV